MKHLCTSLIPVSVLILIWALSARALDGYVLCGDEWFGLSKVYLIDCETGDKRTLVDEPAWGACFNADGSRIAYYRSRGSRICTRSIDGTDEREVCELSCGKGDFEVSVSWSDDGNLYMSNWTKNVYRVDADGGTPEVAYTSGNTIVAGTASRDGTRYAATVPGGWSVASYDMANDKEHNHGGGCQGSISSDGKWVSHNLDNHHTAYIKEFLSDRTAHTISSPEGEFNMHRFSQHSPKHVCFTCDGNKGYVCDVTSDHSVKVGDCSPYDYFPGELNREVATRGGCARLHVLTSGTVSPTGLVEEPLFSVMINGKIVARGAGRPNGRNATLLYTVKGSQGAESRLHWLR